LSQFVYINFYTTTLSAAMTSTQTTMTVGSATGLPTLTTGQVLPLVLTSSSDNTVHEIVYVTAISSNTLTIERGQEGTAGNTWAIGDYVSCDTTAGSVVASGDDVSFGTVDATGLITANGGLTVPSGQTATVAGTLSVTGSETVASSTITTLDVTGTTTLSGALNANGGLTVPSGQTATVAGTLSVTGSATVPAATASTNPAQFGQLVDSGTLTNVTSSRALNTTYTNAEGHAILVQVVCYTATSGSGTPAVSMLGYVNGGIAAAGGGAYTTNATYFGLTMWVPSGATYEISTVSGSGQYSLNTWVEVR